MAIWQIPGYPTAALIGLVAAGLALAGCGAPSSDPAPQDPGANQQPAFAWPASLPVFGDGFPAAGAACRRIGESPETVNFLDDSASLVGCPSADEAARLGGTILKTVDGVVLVSVPNSPQPIPGDGDGQGDAKVAGTDYDATAQLRCAGYRGMKATMCDAGVKRNQEDGQTLVFIDWPDGVNSRMLIFDRAGKILTANTNEADGSSKFEVLGKREGDTTVVTIGPERYEVPDVFIRGD
ncbi:hypothetical protein [Blastomonas sp.]|uniref:hypothetical protein n=1 Tax=Blastomonas sp. TaxID=1909299 RepID=UPI00260DB6A9|nr:hypothetical protein [Blastomonas sp.]MDM7956074.1 hypothetical protein [Blastomonas sp.]